MKTTLPQTMLDFWHAGAGDARRPDFRVACQVGYASKSGEIEDGSLRTDLNVEGLNVSRRCWSGVLEVCINWLLLFEFAELQMPMYLSIHRHLGISRLPSAPLFKFQHSTAELEAPTKRP